MKYLKSFFIYCKKAFTNWQKDKSSMLGASLAYYSVFSLAPLLLVVISLLGLFLGKEAVSGHIYDQLKGLLGKDGANGIELMIAHAAKPKTGTIAVIIGTITLILGASGVFGQLQEAFNQIWDVKKARGGIGQMFKDRFLSMGMVATLAFLLGISLIASAGITTLTNHLHIFGTGIFLEIINEILSAIILTILFAFLYKTLSKVKLTWKSAFAGALVAGILFTLGKTVIGIYIGNSSLSSSYGPSSALIVILLWVYYTAQIMLYGIEFTKVYAEDHGLALSSKPAYTKVQPKKLTSDEQEKQKRIFLLGGYAIAGAIKAWRGKKKKK